MIAIRCYLLQWPGILGPILEPILEPILRRFQWINHARLFVFVCVCVNGLITAYGDLT